jgi:hypothetical protein
MDVTLTDASHVGYRKSMKVADLKAVLQQAGVSFSAKLTKSDLIKKIIETPAAVAVASGSENGPTEDDLVRSPSFLSSTRYAIYSTRLLARLTPNVSPRYPNYTWH